MIFGRSLIFSLFFSLVFAAFGCKKLENSNLKHSWGETSRSPETFSFYKCDNFENRSFKKTQLFLRELASHIMKTNPNTFKKGTELDPSKFCFNVQDARNKNAYAHIRNRAVRLLTGLIKDTESVNEIAYILSHELAHITMAHSDRTHPSYVRTAKYISLIADLRVLTDNGISKNIGNKKSSIDECLKPFGEEEGKRIRNSSYSDISEVFCRTSYEDTSTCQNKLSLKDLESSYVSKFPSECKNQAQQLFAANIEYGNWQKKVQTLNYDSLMDQMKKEMEKDPAIGVEKASNWTEREADDVGAEIYYRAGFSPDKVSNFLTVAAHRSLADSDGITTKECMAFANSRSLSDLDDILHSKVDRGDGTHPKPCWRLIHLIYEKELHRNDIASLNPPTGVEAKFEKLLQESKDEIAKNSFYK